MAQSHLIAPGSPVWSDSIVDDAPVDDEPFGYAFDNLTFFQVQDEPRILEASPPEMPSLPGMPSLVHLEGKRYGCSLCVGRSRASWEFKTPYLSKRYFNSFCRHCKLHHAATLSDNDVTGPRIADQPAHVRDLMGPPGA